MQWVAPTGAAMAAGNVGVIACNPLSRLDWRGLWAVPALLLLLTVPMGAMAHADRLRRTSRPQGQMIRAVAGPDAHLMTCALALDQPELFYYSGLPTRATNTDLLQSRDVPSHT